MRPILPMASLLLLPTPLLAQIPPSPTATQPSTMLPAVAPLTRPVSLNVRDFGAKADGTTNDTAPLQSALDRCWVLGGGQVLLPAGTYLTGSLELHSNTTLHLDQGATLQGSPDINDYPVTQTRWEGKWIPGHRALLYAADAHHIAILGPGKIVGADSLGGRPSKDNPLRHPALIEPTNCSDVRLENFSTSYARMWSTHLVYCTNVSINHLTIRSTGGNGDGIDVDSSSHVRITNCDISTGDDCIALKSGRGMEGFTLLRTTDDVSISNCTLADSIFACIGIGSETSGGIRNVNIDHCRFTHAKTFALYIKSRPGRGAFITDIHASDLDVSDCAGGFLRINLLNSGLQDPQPVPGPEGIPTARNYTFSNIHITNSGAAVDAINIPPEKPLHNLTLSNLTGETQKGLTLANIQNATLKNIAIKTTPPLLTTTNVTGTGLDQKVDQKQE